MAAFSISKSDCKVHGDTNRNEVIVINVQIIDIVDQKSGVGKTTTCVNLGIGLAQAGRNEKILRRIPQGL